MICRAVSQGPCRTYLLVSEKTKEAVLVDPLLDHVDDYLKTLKDAGLKLVLVLDTHTHADHLSAGTVLQEKTGAPYAMHSTSRVASATRRLSGGETLGYGDLKISLLHTPGHTADSLTVVLDDRVLSGDFLFSGPDGAGRLDLPGSDPAVHFDSLRRLDALPGSLLLFPAHQYAGSIGATLGEERKTNPVLSPRAREEYLRWWEAKRFGAADWMKDVVKANLAGARDAKAVCIPKDQAACACAAGPAPALDLPQISAEDLAKRLEAKPDAYVLLDVRTPEEFDDELGHVSGAVLIPVDELSGRLAEVPSGPVAVICRSGKRASRAAAMLQGAGRTDVRVMTGGMLAWNEARLPVA